MTLLRADLRNVSAMLIIIINKNGSMKISENLPLKKNKKRRKLRPKLLKIRERLLKKKPRELQLKRRPPKKELTKRESKKSKRLEH